MHSLGRMVLMKPAWRVIFVQSGALNTDGQKGTKGRLWSQLGPYFSIVVEFKTVVVPQTLANTYTYYRLTALWRYLIICRISAGLLMYITSQLAPPV